MQESCVEKAGFGGKVSTKNSFATCEKYTTGYQFVLLWRHNPFQFERSAVYV